MVGLSTSLSLHLVEARATVAALRAAGPSPMVIVGGAAYCGDADLGAYVGADAFALDAGETSRLLRERFGR